MRALATFIMQGQSRAVMVVAVMAVLSFLLPPLALLSGGGVALVVLHRGGHDGLRVIAWSSVALAALMYVLQQDLSPVVGFALVMWLPVWLVAVVLQATGQPAWALSGAAGLAVLLVLAVYLVLGDPAQMWRDMLHGLFERNRVPLLRFAKTRRQRKPVARDQSPSVSIDAQLECDRVKDGPAATG